MADAYATMDAASAMEIIKLQREAIQNILSAAKLTNEAVRSLARNVDMIDLRLKDIERKWRTIPRHADGSPGVFAVEPKNTIMTGGTIDDEVRNRQRHQFHAEHEPHTEGGF